MFVFYIHKLGWLLVRIKKQTGRNANTDLMAATIRCDASKIDYRPADAIFDF